MALKVLKKCQQCIHNCKQEVDETIWKTAVLIKCPRDKGFKKKNRR